MIVKKLKGSKYAELMVYLPPGGPAVARVETRMKPTEHGEFFKELVLRTASNPYIAHGSGARRMTPEEVIEYCLEITGRTHGAMANDDMLAMSAPPFTGLLKSISQMLAAADPREPADVVQLVPRGDDPGAA